MGLETADVTLEASYKYCLSRFLQVGLNLLLWLFSIQ